jgi:signal peptidase II
MTSAPDAPAGGTHRARRRVGVLAAVAPGVWLLDQATKILAVRELEGREPIQVLGEVLSVRLVYNSGAAFGIAGGMTVLLTLVAAAVAVVILRFARRLRNGWWALALGLMLGGALGNLTDRLLRDPGPLRGHVVDFLELPNWPVFNVADMAVVGGSALMVLLSFRGVPFDGPEPAVDDETAAETDPAEPQQRSA